MIVMKFGGTSVQDAATIRQVVEIVRGRLHRKPVVVVSAIAGVTDGLRRVAQLSELRQFDEASAILDDLCRRHLVTARELLLKPRRPAPQEGSLETIEHRIREHFAAMDALTRSIATLGELTPRSLDALVSFGERLSSLIMAAVFCTQNIPATGVDARDFIVTNAQFTSAAPELPACERKIRKRLEPILEAGRLPVTQGFIGATPDGVTTTLGRGGSDFSASIIGAALRADEIEIWSDVDGLMTADPRVVPEARRLRVISFSEAAALSNFGAKVLHPKTLWPTVPLNIPVRLYNTHNPGSTGTLIRQEPQPSSSPIKSIAFKRGVTTLKVISKQTSADWRFYQALLNLFSRHRLPLGVATTSQGSFSMCLDPTDSLAPVVEEVRSIAEVFTETNKAMICLVGDHLKRAPGIVSRVFQTAAPVNIHTMIQDVAAGKMIFVVDETGVEDVVRALHREFFCDADPALFA